MSTENIESLCRTRNRETCLVATECLIIIGFVLGLSLINPEASYDSILIPVFLFSILATLCWHVGFSLYLGITLHWHAKQRTNRSRRKSSDN